MKEKMSAFSVFRSGSRINKVKRVQNRGGEEPPIGMSAKKRKRLERHQASRRKLTPYRIPQKLKSSLSLNLDQNALSPKQTKNKIDPIQMLATKVEPELTNVVEREEPSEPDRTNRTKRAVRRSVATPLTTPRTTPRKRPREETTRTSERANAVETVVVPPELPYMFDSRLEGEKCFEWLIHPEKPKNFFEKLWEKTPLLVKRHNNGYFRGLFSTEMLDNILREGDVWFGKNIDVTSYADGKRETHNPPGRAFPAIVWDYYQNGCSVRFLNPQTFHRSVWKLNATLQEFFGSFVGANVYLTPPGSQGFAPHYDDIEGFVLQLEGKKNWKLYNPRNTAETLPRFSSGNFSQDEIGDPIIETVLEAGDVLYLPRGFVHQASTGSSVHSLHMTVSTHQRNTWGDFLEKLVPAALQIAFEEDLDYRKSLPRDYMEFVGVSNSDKEDPERKAFLATVEKLMLNLSKYCPIDATADQMSKGFVHDCLPPLLTKDEKRLSIHGSGERWFKGTVAGAAELQPDTRVKLLRASLVRLVMEENGVRVYHSLENSREFHREEAQFIEISPMLAPAVECLLHSYPHFVSVDDLPLRSLAEKMEIANILYDKGLIMTESVETVSD